MRQFYVYILASRSRRLYIGMTNGLEHRVWQHRHGLVKFTRKYQIYYLVYFETTSNPMAAITREKELKGWRRQKKIDLIESVNPAWHDLMAEPINGEPLIATTVDPSLRSG